MLLGGVKPVGFGEAGVELACDVTLEAADGFGFGLAFGAAALEVVAGGGVIGEARDDDAPEGTVGLAVTGPAESVSLLLAAGGVERRSSAEASEGAFVADPVGVLAGALLVAAGEKTSAEMLALALSMAASEPRRARDVYSHSPGSASGMDAREDHGARYGRQR
jgi:hypothetical protein